MKRLKVADTPGEFVPNKDQLYGMSSSQVKALESLCKALDKVSQECDDLIWGDWFKHEILEKQLDISRDLDLMVVQINDLIE